MNRPESVALLGVLADASAALRELTTSLRERPNVASVDRRCDVEGSDDRRSIEWYVDAELYNGEAVSFRLLIFWHSDEWTIESDVRRIHSGGSYEEVGLPTRFAVEVDDLAAEVRSASAHLARWRVGGGLASVRRATRIASSAVITS